MDFISIKEYAAVHGIAERTARNYCVQGKIPGAQMVGKTWSIPADATLPQRLNARKKISPLLQTLREQKEVRRKGGIYHRTQIDLTYNSNHMEGSRLTKEQTRYIFETKTIGATGEAINVDDIIETTNHFRCIDFIIDCVNHGIVPFVITEELKMFYYRGLREWLRTPGFLTDTCLTTQDYYKSVLDYFKIKY